MGTILEQYRISDFVEWFRQERLILNPEFQRGSVWTPAARTFLIDTILRELPIPKIYIRTKIDTVTKESLREVVDGQQRLRAILDFANDKLVLSKRAGELAGNKYSTLTPEKQEVFLSYPLAVGQLLNASNDDVLEVFARLNSYSVQLNAAEKRHARYQGDFKWFVRGLSHKWSVLWESFEILTVRERVRMQDDSLTAEMIGILLEGVKDGGEKKIDSLYKRYDDEFEDRISTVENDFDNTVQYFVDHFAESLKGTPATRPPHFLMLFAGLAHAIRGIPKGDMDGDLPGRDVRALTNDDIALENLLFLSSVIDSDLPSEKYKSFWAASKTTTHRISSRRERFPMFYRALLPKRLE